MRRDVVKFLFVGAEAGRESFFEAVQKAGVVEFISRHGRGPEVPEVIVNIVTAKKALARFEVVHQEDLDDMAEADAIAARVVVLDANIKDLAEELRLLQQEITRVQIFGDFTLFDLEYVAQHNRVMQFYCAKQGTAHDVADKDEVIYVGTAFDLDYYVAINRERTAYPGLTEMHIDRPLGVLQQRAFEVSMEHLACETELKSYAKRRHFLRDALERHLNAYHLLQAQSGVELNLNSRLFAVDGWVPKHLRAKVAHIADDHAVYMEQILVEHRDVTPTYLENERLGLVGEDLVHLYDTPSTQDNDPSYWVLFFFGLFFGLIINDAIYGLIGVALGAFLLRRTKNSKPSMRRFAKLVMILSVFSVICGVFTASYSGIPIAPDSILQKISFVHWIVRAKVEFIIVHGGPLYAEWVKEYPVLEHIPTADGWLMAAKKVSLGGVVYELQDRLASDVMLEVALLVGVVHICLSFARVIKRNWAGVGWILFMIGGYLYFPKMLHATSMVNYLFGLKPQYAAYYGLQILWSGIILALILGFIQRRWSGLMEIAHAIQVFADVLSYLRLYALGVAALMMSTTFNDMALSAGPVFAVPILLIGHTLNFSLSIMAGIIHGLRLNFLEWYRHCFVGGGKMFNPLKLIGIGG